MDRKNGNMGLHHTSTSTSTEIVRLDMRGKRHDRCYTHKFATVLGSVTTRDGTIKD